MTNVSAFFDEFVGSTVLMIVVLAITDRKNGPPPAGLAPLAIFFLVLGIGCAFGLQTGKVVFFLRRFYLFILSVGYAINPARDLGPRLLTAMVGYGKQVFTYRK